MRERENNMDLLRVVSMIAVVCIHVGAVYKDAMTETYLFGELYKDNMFFTSVTNALGRFAVPCFFMLGGGYILGNQKNSDFKSFYKGTFVKIGIPMLVFSLAYFMLSEFYEISGIVLEGESFMNLLTPVKNWFIGLPYYHMWYMYTLIGVYLAAPILVILKREVGEKAFAIVSIISIPIICVCYMTSSHLLYWDIGLQLYYVGYFALGYVLLKWGNQHKDNRKGIGLICIGILVFLFAGYLRYQQALAGFNDLEVPVKLLGYFSPLPTIGSICIFLGFSRITVKKSFARISDMSFYIYLFHAGVWSIIEKFVLRGVIGTRADSRVVIIVGTVIVLIISYGLSVAYLHIWKKVDKRTGITKAILQNKTLSPR